MARVKVSKNLYRGSRVRSICEVHWLALEKDSIAWLREDGTYLVRPAFYFSLWGNDVLEGRLENMYYTTPYKSFWAWLKDFFCKKS